MSDVAGIRAELAEGETIRAPRQAVSAFYVLFSFDLVNSTFYKTLNESGWPLVITQFYSFVEDGLKKRLPRVFRWKYVGDELLLYKKIESIDDLRGCVERAYATMKSTIDLLHNRFRDTRTVLSVKTTVWCARVHDVPSAEIQSVGAQAAVVYRNLVISHPSGPDDEQLDSFSVRTSTSGSASRSLPPGAGS